MIGQWQATTHTGAPDWWIVRVVMVIYRCIVCFIYLANEETPPGIKQSGNAKITFNDDDYFHKVTFYQFVLNFNPLYSQSLFLINQTF